MSYFIKDLGDLFRLDLHFTNFYDELHDPDVVHFSYKSPAGVITNLTYGTDVELVRESTGIYYVLMDCTESGFWFFRSWAEGNGQAAKEGRFLVRPSQVVEEEEESSSSSSG